MGGYACGDPSREVFVAQVPKCVFPHAGMQCCVVVDEAGDDDPVALDHIGAVNEPSSVEEKNIAGWEWYLQSEVRKEEFTAPEFIASENKPPLVGGVSEVQVRYSAPAGLYCEDVEQRTKMSERGQVGIIFNVLGGELKVLMNPVCVILETPSFSIKVTNTYLRAAKVYDGSASSKNARTGLTACSWTTRKMRSTARLVR